MKQLAECGMIRNIVLNSEYAGVACDLEEYLKSFMCNIQSVAFTATVC